MNLEHINKEKNDSRNINSANQESSSTTTVQRFEDNRPETVAQMKMQEMMANGSETMQLKAKEEGDAIESKETTQLQENSDGDATPTLDGGAPNNTGLPDNLKSGMENLSGMALDDVNVHYNSGEPAQLQAHAYAQGSEIHLGPGQEKHLPHELGHVVQQKEGRVKPTMQMKGVGVNDDDSLEKEADVLGEKALQMKATKTDEPKSSGTLGHSKNVAVQRHIMEISELTGSLDEEILKGKGIIHFKKFDDSSRNTAQLKTQEELEAEKTRAIAQATRFESVLKTAQAQIESKAEFNPVAKMVADTINKFNAKFVPYTLTNPGDDESSIRWFQGDDYDNLNSPGIWGKEESYVAGVFTSGQTEIRINSWLYDKPALVRANMVHEVTHMKQYGTFLEERKIREKKGDLDFQNDQGYASDGGNTRGSKTTTIGRDGLPKGMITLQKEFEAFWNQMLLGSGGSMESRDKDGSYVPEDVKGVQTDLKKRAKQIKHQVLRYSDVLEFSKLQPKKEPNSKGKEVWAGIKNWHQMKGLHNISGGVKMGGEELIDWWIKNYLENKLVNDDTQKISKWHLAGGRTIRNEDPNRLNG